VGSIFCCLISGGNILDHFRSFISDDLSWFHIISSVFFQKNSHAASKEDVVPYFSILALGGFNHFYVHPKPWGDDPIGRAYFPFFKGVVSTTNQLAVLVFSKVVSTHGTGTHPGPWTQQAFLAGNPFIVGVAGGLPKGCGISGVCEIGAVFWGSYPNLSYLLLVGGSS